MELVERVLQGDPAAQEEFFGLFRPRLFRAALYFLGSQDSEAEDIVQDTFLIALPKLKEYDFRAPIYAWLRQICLRLCYARMRSRRRVLISAHEDLEVFMRRMAMERLQGADLDLQRRQQLELMRQVRFKLKPSSRQIIELRGVQGMSYAQISRELAVPIGTVMSRLSRAREQLRKLMDEAPEQSVTSLLARTESGEGGSHSE